LSKEVTCLQTVSDVNPLCAIGARVEVECVAERTQQRPERCDQLWPSDWLSVVCVVRG